VVICSLVCSDDYRRESDRQGSERNRRNTDGSAGRSRNLADVADVVYADRVGVWVVSRISIHVFSDVALADFQGRVSS